MVAKGDLSRSIVAGIRVLSQCAQIRRALYRGSSATMIVVGTLTCAAFFLFSSRVVMKNRVISRLQYHIYDYEAAPH